MREVEEGKERGRYVCRYCGSADLRFSANVVWDVKTQRPKITDWGDEKPYCNGEFCGGEQTTWAKFVALERSP